MPGGALGALRRAGYLSALSFTDSSAGAMMTYAGPWDAILPFFGGLGSEAQPDTLCLGGSRTYAELVLAWNLAQLRNGVFQSGTYDPGGVVGRYQQTLNDSFSAVSKPIFASE